MPRVLAMNEVFVPFPCARRAAQQNQFLGETQLVPAKFGFEVLPDRRKDQLSIFDLQIVDLFRSRRLWDDVNCLHAGQGYIRLERFAIAQSPFP